MIEAELIRLFASAVGKAAGPLIEKAAEKHVEGFFGEAIQKVAALGKKKPTVEAMERAWAACVELILVNVKALGDYEEDDPEFKACAQALTKLLDDDAVGRELLLPLGRPGGQRIASGGDSARCLDSSRWIGYSRGLLLDAGHRFLPSAAAEGAHRLGRPAGAAERREPRGHPRVAPRSTPGRRGALRRSHAQEIPGARPERHAAAYG